MKNILLLLMLMLYIIMPPGLVYGADCNSFALYHAQDSLPISSDAILSWDAPTTNADGTTLTDLAGYKIYVGRATGVYDAGVIDVGNILTITLTNFCEGVYFFVATAYDTSGNESVYSNEVSKSLNLPPAMPGNMR